MQNKLLSIILLCLICTSSCVGLFYPRQKARAYPAEIISDPFTTAGWTKFSAWATKDSLIQAKGLTTTVAEWLWNEKNGALRVAMAKFRKVLLDYMVNEIVTWIQGGGKPLFVTDWKRFLKNVGDVAGGQALEQLLGQDILSALCNPNWAIQLNIALRVPRPFEQTAMCTLSDIGVNFDNFIKNFNSGSWKAWFRITESQNNPYGLYLATLNEKLERENKAIEAAKNEVQTGFGFLSDKVCKKMSCIGGAIYTGTFKESEIGWECNCDQWEVRTPGKMLADTLQFGVESPMNWLVSNEEWESYVVAITDALINRLIKEGVLAITSADSSSSANGSFSYTDYGNTTASSNSAINQSGLLDTTAPITKATVFDGWHMQITSNENAFIYYTVDGTEPTISSTPYTGPIEILTDTTLKWMAMDYSTNKEAPHSVSLYPPFTTDQTPPTTVAMAANQNSIALISDKPATIYYSVDGSDPSTSSLRYIKLLENLDPLTPIKWFGVSSQGIQELIVHEIGVIPPFPNGDFPKIIELIKPEAVITKPSSASGGQFFTLDASLSKDNDTTPKIVMYEWDFDNDGTYDWWIVDWNKDGVFDESQYKTDYINQLTSLPNISNGFQDLIPSALDKPTIIKVKFSSGQRKITLRVTDDEGLYNTVSAVVNVQ